MLRALIVALLPVLIEGACESDGDCRLPCPLGAKNVCAGGKCECATGPPAPPPEAGSCPVGVCVALGSFR